MFDLKSNVIFINPVFYAEDGNPTNSFVVEKSDFTAKSNGVELVAETIFTVADPKRGKKSALVKIITPKDKIDSNSDVEYSHTNKFIEKYKSINTTLNLLGEDVESDGRKYIVVAIPFNGTMNSIEVNGNFAEIVSAQYNSTAAIKFNVNDKLLYGKIAYLVIKIIPSAQGFEDTVISFATVSIKKNNEGPSTQTTRNIAVTVPVSFVTEVTEESKYVVPLVTNTETTDIELDANGNMAPAKKFSELFDIKIDKTIRNHGYNNNNNGDRRKKSSGYFTKKKDDMVTNFFNTEAYNEKPMSKKFAAAKKRYSEYDDE
jgi:hypothetical protein